jgi:hypothetical protein
MRVSYSYLGDEPKLFRNLGVTIQLTAYVPCPLMHPAYTHHHVAMSIK